MKDKPELQQLVEAISSYRMMLKLLNITDDQVKYFKSSFLTQVVLMVFSLLRLLLSLIFVLPGNIITFPLSTAIYFYCEQERVKALKKSSVKVKANDVLASVKMVAYISTYPIYTVLFTFIFKILLTWYFQMEKGHARYYSTVFFFLFPVISIVSIRSHDGVRTHYTEFHGRFLSLFYTNQVDLIKSTRKTLKTKVRTVVDKVGPQVFKNFDKMRLIMFDPSVGAVKRDHVVKSNSTNKLTKSPQKARNPHSSSQAELGKKEPISNVSSRRPSFEMPNTKSATDYDIDYLDELELNRAFNVFKDI
uniref:Uncharacterized protein n=1 Tax=Strombidium rassoulzadegani TaxID=1082188 RepID=A0A7S3FS93_9SPIT|mmetsp:Transcript_13221/g.22427  ORF Transcript_13221/g.22427 Transcript_13221/m.22427 type:complete len:305 (+) Transcript_13221:1391-2305(+)